MKITIGRGNRTLRATIPHTSIQTREDRERNAFDLKTLLHSRGIIKSLA